MANEEESFGGIFRQIKIGACESFASMSDHIGISAATISAYESHRRSVPDSFVDIIVKAYRPTADRTDALRHAAERTRQDLDASKLCHHNYLRRIRSLIGSWDMRRLPESLSS